MKRILIIALAFVFVACQTSQSKSTVIDQSGCSLPCWKGITPGKTDKQELLDLLASIPAVDRSSIASIGVPGSYFNDIVRCYIVEPKSMTRFYGYLVDGKVALISLDYIRGDWNLTLEDMIERFGEPEGILVINYGNDMFINLISPTRGIAFGYNTIDKANWWKKRITPENKVGALYLFDPNSFTQLMDTGELSFEVLFGQDAIDSVQPWTGYGSIKEKYLPQR